MADLLLDTLLRPTGPAPAAVDVSAAPVRAIGTRTRAGNAMDRTRAALLDGARRAVEVNGTRITMAQVAAGAGVAKATLYNHFRTKDAVLAALVADEVVRIAAAVAGHPLDQQLTTAAEAICEHPLLRAVAASEPAAVAALARVDTSARGWHLVADAVTAALAAHGRAGTSLVLRWLASFVITPAGRPAIASDVAVLLAGLPAASPGSP